MGRREIGEEHIRKIARTGAGGASYSLTLPKNLVRGLEWKEKQKVVVKKNGQSLVITDWSE